MEPHSAEEPIDSSCGVRGFGPVMCVYMHECVRERGYVRGGMQIDAAGREKIRA